MGFRTGTYATVWEVEPISVVNTKMRISISRKNKKTDEYETDFSGYVMCIGTAAAKKAAALKPKDRIKLGDVDVSTYYDSEKKRGYYNFKIFSFDIANDNNNASKKVDNKEAEEVDNGEPEPSLPF